MRTPSLTRHTAKRKPRHLSTIADRAHIETAVRLLAECQLLLRSGSAHRAANAVGTCRKLAFTELQHCRQRLYRQMHADQPYVTIGRRAPPRGY